jgi:nucleoside-diphosphate-sugar epimerase
MAATERSIPWIGTSRNGRGSALMLDPTKFGDVQTLAASLTPRAAVVCAGQVFGPADEVLDVTMAITKAAIELAARFPVVIVGSIAEYGRGRPDATASTETDPDDPVSAYGTARVAATNLIREAHAAGRSVVCARVANVVSGTADPRQPLGEWIQAVRKANDGDEVSVGNILTERDFVAAADVGEALLALTQPTSQGTVTPHAIVNVSSGVPLSFGDLVGGLIRHSGKRLTIVDRGVPLPIPRIVADPSLLKSMYNLSLARTVDELTASVL